MAAFPAPAPAAVAPAAPGWRAVTRVAFRFCFIYFSLYIVLTQMLTSLLLATTNDAGAFELDQTRPARAVITWIAAHLLHIAHPLVTVETGSGDRVYDWVEVACLLGIAALATLIWSGLDRKRAEYKKLHAWLHLAVRFALGATLLTYGAAKIIPLQMPYPSLSRLLEPFGNFSPMGVLWASIGAAPAYEIFAGGAELLGGALLLFPRTATLGGLIALADGAQVFMLNMSYDVPVKLLAFHLIPMALFVLAPEWRRLGGVLLTRGAVPAAAGTPLFQRPRANRIAAWAQAGVAVLLLGANLSGSVKAYSVYGPGRPRSPLYGIWTVMAPEADGPGWRRVIFDTPGRMGVQGQDGDEKVQFFAARIDAGAGTIALTRADDKSWQAVLHFTRAGDAMTMDGDFDRRPLHAQFTLADRSQFLLLNRGFHWVQDYPFNR